jgi:hypothetical protein
MPAPTEIYVDPAINANSGAGTIGNPYGDLQFALNSVTRDSTNGNRFNIKAGTAEVLAATISFTTYGTPTATAPCIFEGYTAAAGDGGLATISCGGGAFGLASSVANCYWKCLTLTGSSASIFANMTTNNNFDSCVFTGLTGTGIHLFIGGGTVTRCQFVVSTSAVAITTSADTFVGYNYLSGPGAGASGIRANAASGTSILRNIIVGFNTYGILGTNLCEVHHNTVFATGATGRGIWIENMISARYQVLSNYVEGYSGAGGQGYDLEGDVNILGMNAAFGNTTNFTYDSDIHINAGDNEVLASSGLAKSGAMTFANRAVYFAPADVGNMRSGGFPGGTGLSKGAIQFAGGSSRPMNPFLSGVIR